jgi:hypothetical protein
VNDELRAELLELAAADRRFREDPELVRGGIDAAAIAAERARGRRIAGIVADGGWPGAPTVGEDGSSAAWLLVQHADQDVGFQERALALLQEAVAAGEASAREAAYLTDRVRVNRGLPQLYGTQFHGRGESFGPLPIEDAERLDERRAEAGLESFAENEQRLRRVIADHDLPDA